jgi:hypothetical protein
MTRGKYAARAARRREDESVQAEIGTYQHHVARLTREVSELTGKLAAERAGRKADVGRLTAERDEGLSPEVAALRGELERQRERAEQAKASMRGLHDAWNRIADRLFRLFGDPPFNLTGTEAAEVILYLVGQTAEDAKPGDQPRISEFLTDLRHGLSPERLHNLDVAKGKRHRGDISALLTRRLREQDTSQAAVS